MRTQLMPAADFGRLTMFLGRNGLAAQAARQVIGTSPNGKTRAQIADDLRRWLKARPRSA